MSGNGRIDYYFWHMSDWAYFGHPRLEHVQGRVRRDAEARGALPEGGLRLGQRMLDVRETDNIKPAEA